MATTRKKLYLSLIFSSLFLVLAVTAYLNQQHHVLSLKLSSSSIGLVASATEDETLGMSNIKTKDTTNINKKSNNKNDQESCQIYNESVQLYPISKSQPSMPDTLGTCRKFTFKSQKERQEMESIIEQVGEWSHIKKFVMFFGFARSGHTWIGSILDAAPNAIIANEWNIVGHWNQLKLYNRQKNNNITTQQYLYNKLAQNSYLCGLYGRIQIYDYTINGLWQGKLLSADSENIIIKTEGDMKNNNNKVISHNKIEIIGDKKGELTTNFFLHLMDRKNNRMAWNDVEIASLVRKTFDELMDIVTGKKYSNNINEEDENEKGKVSSKKTLSKRMRTDYVEPRLIVVLRNPYDLIATYTIRGHANKKVDIGGHVKEKTVKMILLQYQFIFWAIQNLGQPSHWHVLTTEDFDRNTEKELQKLCDFTTVKCPPILHAKVRNQTRHSTHMSRLQVQWTQKIVQMVHEFIANSDLSKYYSACYFDPK